jgi:hypothetical protein
MAEDGRWIVPPYKSGLTPVQANCDAAARACEKLVRSMPRDESALIELERFFDDQLKQATDYVHEGS